MEYLLTGVDLPAVQGEQIKSAEQNYRDSLYNEYRKKYESLKENVLKAVELADKVSG